MTRSLRIFVVIVVLTTVSLAAAEVSSTAHFRLERSEPAADSAVVAPAEVRLCFSQEPQDGSTSIRVVDAEGKLAGGGTVTVAEDDPRVRFLVFQAPLAPGHYRVMWRAMAADGHVVRDAFDFTVDS